MSDWMKDFDEAKKKEGQNTSKRGECKSCNKVKKLGDDGNCTRCFVKGK